MFMLVPETLSREKRRLEPVCVNIVLRAAESLHNPSVFSAPTSAHKHTHMLSLTRQLRNSRREQNLQGRKERSGDATEESRFCRPLREHKHNRQRQRDQTREADGGWRERVCVCGGRGGAGAEGILGEKFAWCLTAIGSIWVKICEPCSFTVSCLSPAHQAIMLALSRTPHIPS